MSGNLTLEYWRDGDAFAGRLLESPSVSSRGDSLDDLIANICEAFEVLVVQDRDPAPAHAERTTIVVKLQ